MEKVGVAIIGRQHASLSSLTAQDLQRILDNDRHGISFVLQLDRYKIGQNKDFV